VTTGDGNDTVFCLAGNDVVHSGGGDDTVFAAHTDTVDAGAGNNNVFVPYNDDPTVTNTGGGHDTVYHRKLSKLQAFRVAFIDLLGLDKALKDEL
jgi:Ca2+-binding RTX toxin-like protein